MFENEVIGEIYALHNEEFQKINAQVCIFSLADPNAGHCVELTFLDNGQGSI